MNASMLAPDDLWQAIAPLLCKEPPKPQAGRQRVPDRAALGGIIVALRTGCPWRLLPKAPSLPALPPSPTAVGDGRQGVRVGRRGLLDHPEKENGLMWSGHAFPAFRSANGASSSGLENVSPDSTGRSNQSGSGGTKRPDGVPRCPG